MTAAINDGSANPHEFLDLMGESAMLRSMEGRIDAWNHEAAQLYGWQKEEAIGRISHELLQTQFPKPLEEIESDVVRNGCWEGKLVHTTKDGRRLVVESRWSVDRALSEALVEINTPIDGIDPQAAEATAPVELNERSERRMAILVKLADFAIAAGLIGALFTLYYYYYYYNWTEQRNFVGPLSMLLYYGVPAALAAVLFVALRCSPSVRVNVALVLFSTCASLYLLELLLVFYEPPTFGVQHTLWFPPKTKKELRDIVATAKKFGVDFDTRGKLEIIADLRRQGIKAVPSIVPAGLLKKEGNGSVTSRVTIGRAEVLPLAGISKSVTVSCNESGSYLVYESDRQGFHNPGDIWKAGRVDIAAVGDSYTQGYCVPSDSNFVGVIRRRYPATLNVGMAGNGPLMELATIKEYLPAVKPRIVLWFFWEGNDFLDLRTERHSRLLMRYLEENFSQKLFKRQSEIDAALLGYIEQARGRAAGDWHSADLPEGKDKRAGATATAAVAEEVVKLSNLRQHLGLVGKDASEPTERKVSNDELQLFGRILAEAKATVASWGGTLYFVYLPERERYANPGLVTLSDHDREQVFHTARSAGIAVIDISSVFQSHPDPLSLFPFRRLGHYNESGHRLVAEAVMPYLPSSR